MSDPTRTAASPGAEAPALADWDLARRLATHVAAGARPRPTRAEAARLRGQLHQIVAEVEPEVRAATDLGHDLPRPTVRVVGRSGWVRANLAALAWLTAPVAQQLLERSPVGREVAQRVYAVQLGAVLGYLATRVLGQYEVLRPGGAPGRLLLVGPNLLGAERTAAEQGLDAEAVQRGVVAHELAHHLQFEGVPWLREELTTIVEGYLADVQVDRDRVRELARRVPELIADPTRLRDPSAWLELLLTPQQSALLERAQSLMSLLEGHGNAAMDWTAARDPRVADPAAVRQLLQRRREQAVDRVVRDALGLSMKAKQYRVGERFVLDVADRHGLAALNRVWAGPEHLPTAEELEDPDAWVGRVAA